MICRKYDKSSQQSEKALLTVHFRIQDRTAFSKIIDTDDAPQLFILQKIRGAIRESVKARFVEPAVRRTLIERRIEDTGLHQILEEVTSIAQFRAQSV